jgi:hypothetical protein
MPQLDQINYFPQVLWLVVTFLILYTFFLKDYIPFIFKLKKKHTTVTTSERLKRTFLWPYSSMVGETE